MKKKMMCLLVGLVAFSPALLRAEEPKPEKRPAREEFKNLTPEEREAKIKEWREKNPNQGGDRAERFREEMKELNRQLGLDPEKMKDLSFEERRTKFREAAETKAAELNKKKTDGTITEEEQKFLDKLGALKKRGEEFRRRGGPGGPGGGPGGPANEKDARKPGPPATEEKK